MWCATERSFLALRAGTKGQLWGTPTARCQGLRAKDQWKWRSGTAMMLWEATLFTMCCLCRATVWKWQLWAQLWLEAQASVSPQMRLIYWHQMRDSNLWSRAASFSTLNQEKPDYSSDKNKKGYQWCNVVAPTTGAPQPAGYFIACQCGRARVLRSVYSF